MGETSNLGAAALSPNAAFERVSPTALRSTLFQTLDRNTHASWFVEWSVRPFIFIRRDCFSSPLRNAVQRQKGRTHACAQSFHRFLSVCSHGRCSTHLFGTIRNPRAPSVFFSSPGFNRELLGNSLDDTCIVQGRHARRPATGERIAELICTVMSSLSWLLEPGIKG